MPSVGSRHRAQLGRKQLVRLKRFWRRATLRRRVIIILVILLVCVAVGSFALSHGSPKKSASDSQTTARSQRERSTIPDSSTRLVPSGKSTVCSTLPLQKIREASKQTFETTATGLPDVKTQDGMTSGCVYKAADSANQSIHSINIFVRTINDTGTAEKEYARLTQRGGREVFEQGIRFYYLSDVNQAIMRQGNHVITLVLVKFEADSKVTQTDFVNILLAVIAVYK